MVFCGSPPTAPGAAAAGRSADEAHEDESSAGHLLVDLPSVDKEDDGGALIAHRTFFGVTATGTYHPLSAGPVVRAKRSETDSATSTAEVAAPSTTDGPSYMPHRTITEFCMFDNALPDGLYALSLQAAAIELDAAPSRPLLAPLVHVV
jgi:hypothetical protein